MSTKSIKKNYIYNVIYQLFIIIIPLVTAPYIARVLQPEGIGQNSYAISLISYFTAFASLGFVTYAQREIARYRDDKTKQSLIFWEILICRALPVTIALIVNLSLCFVGVYGDYTVLMLIGSISIFAVAIDLSFIFQGNEAFGSLVLRNVIVKIVGIVLIFVFVKNTSQVWLYTLINVSTTLFGNFLMIPNLRKLLIKICVKDLKPFRHLFGTLMLFIPAIATTAYVMIDKTLIGVLIKDTYIIEINNIEKLVKYSDIENGYYAQSENIVKMAMTLITCLGTVMIPRNSHDIALGHMDTVRENVYKSSRLVWLLGIPLTLGIIAVAGNFVPWFFGDGYEKCISLLMMFSPLILIIGFSNLFSHQLIAPMGHDKFFILTSIIGLGLNAGLNILLIPKFWAVGAVIASLAAEFSVTSLMAIKVRKEINLGKIILSCWKYAVSGGIMFVVVYFTANFLPSTWWATLSLILMGAIVYFIMLLILQDRLIKNVLSKIAAKVTGRK